jgi:hypothetical protein
LSTIGLWPLSLKGLAEADWAAVARISYLNAGLRKEVTE